MKSLWPFLTTICLSASLPAAEPSVTASDLPRVPPTEPAQALSTFTLREGFELQLVAAEPLVVDPVAADFDANGNLFVVEMRDYSERRPEQLGRIRRLVDTDGDGRFDKSTIFVDWLPWPTAVVCVNDGVLVGTTPEVLFFKDNDGDGLADSRQPMLTGFANDAAPHYATNKLNVQALMNSFHWTLENRVEGAAGMVGGKVISFRKPGATHIEMRGRDFSFDPRTLDLRAESGGAQHGMSFDDAGRKFATSNSDHIQQVMYGNHYAGLNPHYALPGARLSIAVDGPAAEVYRRSPEEPWRVLRTKWRVSGEVSGPIEGGGRSSGYFTGATGVTIYRGNAWPEEYLGDAFIADCGSNLVHRKKLRPDGVALLAERLADEQKVEFLASTDNWFRPVQFLNAPDGTLYVLDMYRETIEHPWSLPPNIKKHLDLNSGNDRGRIYRIVPKGFQQPAPTRLSKAPTTNLVALLEHPNGWHRDTASRLLYERQDKSVVPQIEALFQNSQSWRGRLHALSALSGLGALTESHVLAALKDSAPEVREAGIRWTETIMQPGQFSEALQNGLHALENDPAVRVRYQLALTVGYLQHPRQTGILVDIIRLDPSDRWLRAAVLNSLTDNVGGVFGSLVKNVDWNRKPGAGDFLQDLAAYLGARQEATDLANALTAVKSLPQPQNFSVLQALGTGWQRGGGNAQVFQSGEAKPLLVEARSIATNRTARPNVRQAATSLLSLDTFAEILPTLKALLAPEAGDALQRTAIETLGRFNEPSVSTVLLAAWSSFTPSLRGAALEILMRRPERIATLLDALEQKRIPRTDLSAIQIAQLRQHTDPAIKARAAKWWGEAGTSSRAEVLQQFQPALQLTGDIAKGKQQFEQRCASCHRLAGLGIALGPDLASVRSSGRETLLGNILDPNREVAPQYSGYTAELKDGETYTGLILTESANSLTLRTIGGQDTVIARSQMESLKASGQSLMPEGLEAGMQPQDMADLLEFILKAEVPTK